MRPYDPPKLLVSPLASYVLVFPRTGKATGVLSRTRARRYIASDRIRTFRLVVIASIDLVFIYLGLIPPTPTGVSSPRGQRPVRGGCLLFVGS